MRSAFALPTLAAGLVAAALARTAPDDGPSLVDVTENAGLAWGCGLVAGEWNLVETMGGGGGFLDYDGDGRLDVYLVANSFEPDPRTGKPAGDGLFRNNGDGTFTDVTARAGIRGRRRGMGLAVGDYDNDGRPDIYVSAHATGVLYHNEGDGTFRDVTEMAGVSTRLWGCSTTFLDYDRDGRLDLFVSNYLEFDPSKPTPSR
ncbi:MAG TPA: VCBS repeat-containing protein, partial [Vicinamibacteria bacterium]|nr:VCBS repeat-containing protein [Vicinamibacteria bacterium]